MSTPAGWYPQDDGQQRYWDGTQWTEHFAPGTAAGPAAGAPAGASAVGDTAAYSYTTPFAADGSLGAASYPAANAIPAQRPWFKKKRFLIPGGAVALILVASMASAAGGGGSTPEPASAAAGLLSASSTPTPSAEPVEATATPTPTKAVATPAPKPVAAKPAAPTLTVAQENAKGSAEDYLDMSGFSKKGLIEQLKFEGYKSKDIDAALATMRINWNAEAAESAESYVSMSHFSHKSLTEQLEFEGFTSKQAAYGVKSVGL
jgi:hypothetical protein